MVGNHLIFAGIYFGECLISNSDLSIREWSRVALALTFCFWLHDELKPMAGVVRCPCVEETRRVHRETGRGHVW